MALGTSSGSAKVRRVRDLLRLLRAPAVVGACLAVCLVVQLPASAQAATRWGPVRSKDRVAVASGTWDTGSRYLTLTLSDRSRGPKCSWVVVKAGGYAVPFHACGSTKALAFRVTETGPVSLVVCSGTKRAAAATTCRTKVLV
jgi:hypothetical protein